LEFCPGGDVNRLLCSTKDENGGYMGLPVETCATYSGQVLLALVHLHEVLGIVYRDVKPENILIAASGEAKLADFGLAVYVGKKYRKRMSVAGTAGFLAPELVYGTAGESGIDDRVDPFKTDAYSLGVTLEVMLLGEECAEIQEDVQGDRWMVPKGLSEEQTLSNLSKAAERGRISTEAYKLLAGLRRHRPAHRWCLLDQHVLNHPFFLRTLDCEDLKAHLMPPRLSSPQGTFDNIPDLARSTDIETFSFSIKE
jgi:serine/threonine protein kinase